MVGDLIVERFCVVVKNFLSGTGSETISISVEGIHDSKEHWEVERLRRALEIVSVPCSVRQGSRMSRKPLYQWFPQLYNSILPHTEQQLSRLASEFPALLAKVQTMRSQTPAIKTQSLEPGLMKCVAALLTAGDMALWLGPGRKVLSHSWDVPAFGTSLHGALAEKELGWGGWKFIGLQGVLKVSGAALASASATDAGEGLKMKMTALLAGLVRGGRIGEADVDAVWSERVGKWAEDRLTSWVMNMEQSTEELNDILVLSPFIPSLHTHLIKIISYTLETSRTQVEIESEYEETHANSTWVLGSCLHGLAKMKKSPDVKELGEKIGLAAWISKVVEKWAWSGWVLGGLAGVIKTWYVGLDYLPTIPTNCPNILFNQLN